MVDNVRGGVHYGDKVPRPPSRGFEPGARGTERRPEAPRPEGRGAGGRSEVPRAEGENPRRRQAEAF